MQAKVLAFFTAKLLNDLNFQTIFLNLVKRLMGSGTFGYKHNFYASRSLSNFVSNIIYLKLGVRGLNFLFCFDRATSIFRNHGYKISTSFFQSESDAGSTTLYSSYLTEKHRTATSRLMRK